MPAVADDSSRWARNSWSLRLMRNPFRSKSNPMRAHPANDDLRQMALPGAKAVIGSRNHAARQSPGADGVLQVGVDQVVRGAVHVLVASAHDGGQGQSH